MSPVSSVLHFASLAARDIMRLGHWKTTATLRPASLTLTDEGELGSIEYTLTQRYYLLGIPTPRRCTRLISSKRPTMVEYYYSDSGEPVGYPVLPDSVRSHLYELANKALLAFETAQRSAAAKREAMLNGRAAGIEAEAQAEDDAASPPGPYPTEGSVQHQMMHAFKIWAIDQDGIDPELGYTYGMRRINGEPTNHFQNVLVNDHWLDFLTTAQALYAQGWRPTR